MSCKICHSSSCASWMHSAEEQAEWESLDSLEDTWREEVLGLRREVQELKDKIKELEKTS